MSPIMNILAQLEVEFSYFDVEVQHFEVYNTDIFHRQSHDIDGTNFTTQSSCFSCFVSLLFFVVFFSLLLMFVREVHSKVNKDNV